MASSRLARLVLKNRQSLLDHSNGVDDPLRLPHFQAGVLGSSASLGSKAGPALVDWLASGTHRQSRAIGGGPGGVD